MWSPGRAIAIKMPMIRTTTISSMRVKPSSFRCIFRILSIMLSCHLPPVMTVEERLIREFLSVVSACEERRLRTQSLEFPLRPTNEKELAQGRPVAPRPEDSRSGPMARQAGPGGSGAGLAWVVGTYLIRLMMLNIGR